MNTAYEIIALIVAIAIVVALTINFPTQVLSAIAGAAAMHFTQQWITDEDLQ
jgi:hypothetical protein